MSFFRVVIVGVLLTMLCTGRGSKGQAALASSPPSENPLQPTSQAADHRAEVQRSKTLNANQKRQLIADANKLIELSTALKQQIDTTSPGVLSADAIKNAGEIEKLAHSVKQGLRQYPY